MVPLTQFMDRRGRIARRRDLLSAGYSDAAIRSALERRQIFRVRHGWYALVGTSEVLTQVIRIGGRLTGLSRLRMLDVFLPRRDRLDVAVPRDAAKLRRPKDKRAQLLPRDAVRVHWVDTPRFQRQSSEWMVSEDEALLCVLKCESRELAISCCDALLRYRGWTSARLDAVFALAPRRVQTWRRQVDGKADAWGETVVRLRVTDAGIPFEPQAFVPGVGHLDGRISPRVYLEVDGAQHDEEWTGVSPNTFDAGHQRDALLAIRSSRSIRIGYKQLGPFWPTMLAAIAQARVDDLADLERQARERARSRRNEN